jgi:septum formation protein
MTPLVLASASPIRARILREAGVAFSVRPSDVDEDAIRRDLLPRDGTAVAEALAAEKARRVSRISPGALVLGADQVLEIDGEILSKAGTMPQAREHLLRLRGREHRLLGALVLAKDGAELWRHVAASRLRMRAFSDRFLDAYLAAEGEAILGSVGCYRYEGRGAQLFERVEGDYFAILGLALVPLLAALRDLEALER